MASAVEAMTGLIPVVVAGGMVTSMTKSVFPNNTLAKPKRKSKRQSRKRRSEGLGYGDFSNLSL